MLINYLHIEIIIKFKKKYAKSFSFNVRSYGCKAKKFFFDSIKQDKTQLI